MLNDQKFLEQSINNNLFYLRTLRDFCINIQLSFYENNSEYITRAASLAKKSQDLGRDLVTYTKGVIPKSAIDYQIYFTTYTLDIEKLTEKLFALNLATDITKNQLKLTPGNATAIKEKDTQNIAFFNTTAKSLAKEFVELAELIKTNIQSNDLFSYSYPLLYD